MDHLPDPPEYRRLRLQRLPLGSNADHRIGTGIRVVWVLGEDAGTFAGQLDFVSGETFGPQELLLLDKRRVAHFGVL